MCEQGDIEAHLSAVALDYRSLWLNDANTLGLVAETLREATGWQPSDAAELPDPLALAETAAQRLRQLEAAVSLYQPRLRGRRERVYA